MDLLGGLGNSVDCGSHLGSIRRRQKSASGSLKDGSTWIQDRAPMYSRVI